MRWCRHGRLAGQPGSDGVGCRRPALERETLDPGAVRGPPFIFNLGHGIVPQTPLEHVAELVELVRAA